MVGFVMMGCGVAVCDLLIVRGPLMGFALMSFLVCQLMSVLMGFFLMSLSIMV